MAWCYTCGDDFKMNRFAQTNVCLKGHLLLCDAPWPGDSDKIAPVRCAEKVGHRGRHSGPNGPVWADLVSLIQGGAP